MGMKFLAVLGRTPDLSLAELRALFGCQNVQSLNPSLALIEAPSLLSPADFPFARLGGCLKVAFVLTAPDHSRAKPSPTTRGAKDAVLNYLLGLPQGKITLGFSDYSKNASAKTAWRKALQLKNTLHQHQRSVRIVPNHDSPVISTATALHNGLGQKSNHVEILQFQNLSAVSCGVQDINAYAARDQARPARDAFVGMLPPKLAQILINLATGPSWSQTPKSLLLDPFCGSGVVLQEALLMGYPVFGSDLSPRMVDFSQKNLHWLSSHYPLSQKIPPYTLAVADATSFHWPQNPAFIASELYLGRPLSKLASDHELAAFIAASRTLVWQFLQNLAPQIHPGTTLALALPAWARPDNTFATIGPLDDILSLGYNYLDYQHGNEAPLLYFRKQQLVARHLITLRKA